MIYLILFLLPLIALIAYAIKMRMIYWRMLVYFSIFLLGIFAYASNSFILMIIAWIGIGFMIFMDRRAEIDLSTKNVVISVLAFLSIIFILDNLNMLEMNAGDVFVRFWPLIPLVLGIKNFMFKKGNSKTGLVLIEMAGIFIVLNFLFFYSQSLNWQHPMLFIGLLLFWPAFFFMLFIDFLVSWLKTGDKKYITLFRSKEIGSKDWHDDHSAFLTMFASTKIKLTKEDFLFEKVRRKKVKFSLISIFGKIVLEIPKEIVIISDKSSFHYEFDNDDQNNLFGEELTQLLLRTKAIFGKIKVSRV